MSTSMFLGTQNRRSSDFARSQTILLAANPPGLSALEEVLALFSEQIDDSGVTTREIADALGISEMTALRRVRRLVQAGKLVPVRKRITAIDGSAKTVTAYIPNNSKEKNKEVGNDQRPADVPD